MLELAEQGRVGVAAEGEDVKKGRLVVRDPTLGIFPTTRWPAADSRHEGEIREGHWAAEAVGAAIQAVQTAVSAAVMTAAITSSAGSNGG